jgi:uncharacterized membrane protein
MVPFLSYTAVTYIFSALGLIELINDKMPKTPSRKAPPSFAMRVIIGTLCGAAFGLPSQSAVACAIAGLVGALVGTLGGYEARVRLVRATGGKDLPIALLEDVIAVGGAYLIIRQLS